LISFLAVCLVLASSFLAFSASLKEKIKQGLRDSLHRSEILLEAANAEHAQRTTRLTALLTESAGLKASVGLLREIGGDSRVRKQVQQTIQAQLDELYELVDSELLAVSDVQGQTVAAALLRDGKVIHPELLQPIPPQPLLLDVDGRLYEVETLPILIDGEQIGSLAVGRTFNLTSLHSLAEVALIQGTKIWGATLPPAKAARLVPQLAEKCGPGAAECELELAGETYLVLPMRRVSLGSDYRLLAFYSLDRAMRDFTSGLTRTFVEIGAGGVLLALLFTLLTSWAIS
jgi:hypothetical protein